MKRIALALLVMMVASAARADWPLVGQIIYVSQFGSGSTAIQAAIDACGEGVDGNEGCIVILPRGTTTLTATIVIGSDPADSTLAQMQNGITLQGYGSGFESSTPTNLCGSTLVWGGSNGGTMIQVSGANNTLADFCMDGNAEAGFGIKAVADNPLGGITTHGTVRNVNIEDVLSTTLGTNGWGISIQGQAGAELDTDQNDFWLFQNVRVETSRHCLRSDTSQAFLNRFEQFHCNNFTVSPGIDLIQGNAIFDGYYMNPGVASATGILIRSCGINPSFTHGVWEWDLDGGKLLNWSFSDTCQGGTSYGNQFTGEFSYNRVLLLTDGSPVSPTACIEHKQGNNINVIGNSFSSNDAALTCTFVLDSPNTPQSTVTFLGNDYQFPSAGTEYEPTFTVTRTGAGEMTVLRLDRGFFEVVKPTGSQFLPVVVTRPTADSSAITNTTTETAFSTCSYTVPSGSVSIGTTFRIAAGGFMSGDAVAPGNIAFRVRWGSANTDPLLLDLNQIGTLKLSLSSDGWIVDGVVTIRTLGGTGTASANGKSVVPAVGGTAEVMWDNQNGTTAIDTTTAKALTLFADWGTADTDNTITAETCVIERIN
jgi:hypothetical protein